MKSSNSPVHASEICASAMGCSAREAIERDTTFACLPVVFGSVKVLGCLLECRGYAVTFNLKVRNCKKLRDRLSGRKLSRDNPIVRSQVDFRPSLSVRYYIAIGHWLVVGWWDCFGFSGSPTGHHVTAHFARGSLRTDTASTD